MSSAAVIESLEARRFLAGDLLPDLVPLATTFPITNLHDWRLGGNAYWMPGKTLLRFSNSIGNAGTGALETRALQIINNPTPGQQVDVVQRIYQQEGGFREIPSGYLEYHDQGSHHHFHFEGLAEYNLRAVTAGNGVGAIVRTGGKAGFCLRDSYQYANNPNRPPGFVYFDCYPTSGISPGYADYYGRTLDFQWIDVSGLPAGQYWLESVADPENRILESDESNNAVRILVNLTVPRLGDANGDGQTNYTDFQILHANFGAFGKTWSQGDFTGDGRVDFADFQLLEQGLGSSASPAVVPVPAAAKTALKKVNPVLRPVEKKIAARRAQ